jgi:serine/threonine-protein kinase
MIAKADTARIILTEKSMAEPEDYIWRQMLGEAYALLNRKEEAIREMEMAHYLMPVSKDAQLGAAVLQIWARIYAMFGEYDAAIQHIESLIIAPTLLSVPVLQISPCWDPLRDHPRFQRLVH